MALILFGMFIALLVIGVPVGFSICSAAAVTLFTGLGLMLVFTVIQGIYLSRHMDAADAAPSAKDA